MQVAVYFIYLCVYAILLCMRLLLHVSSASREGIAHDVLFCIFVLAIGQGNDRVENASIFVFVYPSRVVCNSI